MKPSRTRNYLAGLITGYAATLVTVAVGLWLTPFTLRFLDREEYVILGLSRAGAGTPNEKVINA